MKYQFILYFLKGQVYEIPVQSARALDYVVCISTNECPRYNTKQSDDKAPVVELWGMWNTSSFPLIPGPLWLTVVAQDKDLSIGQIELFDISTAHKYMTCQF